MWNIYIKVGLVVILAVGGVARLFKAGQQREGKEFVDKGWKTSTVAGLISLLLALLLVL